MKDSWTDERLGDLIERLTICEKAVECAVTVLWEYFDGTDYVIQAATRRWVWGGRCSSTGCREAIGGAATSLWMSVDIRRLGRLPSNRLAFGLSDESF